MGCCLGFSAYFLAPQPDYIGNSCGFDGVIESGVKLTNILLDGLSTLQPDSFTPRSILIVLPLTTTLLCGLQTASWCIHGQ